MERAAVNVAISGATGRMGRRMAALAEAFGLCVVAGIVRPDHPQLGRTFADVGLVPAESPHANAILRDTLDASVFAAVCLDVSTPAGVAVRAAECAALGVALVTGTTGLDDDAKRAVDAAALRVPVMVAANFSLGVALLVELTRQAVQALGPEFHVEIVELHHARKVDAPSGTALALAHSAAEAANADFDKVALYGREGRTGPRDSATIGVHAVRGGDVIGEHTVYFLGPDERIELTHMAGSRDIFVRGALKAATWLAGRPAGHYGIRDMLLPRPAQQQQ